MSAFEALAAMAPRQIWDGVLARAVHGERVTLGVIELEAGVELPEHRHANEQLGLVLRGTLTLVVAGESRALGPGELWRIPANVPHSGRAGAEGVIAIDVFGPPREDWQRLEPLEPRAPLWP